MTGEGSVYSDCPNCDEEIHVIDALNQGRCPECQFDTDTLFDIAMSEPIEPASPVEEMDLEAAMTDGGLDDE